MRFLVVLALLGLSRPSDACVAPNPETTPFEVDPTQSADTVAPPAPTAEAVVARGQNDNGCSKTDCGDTYANIYLSVVASDDLTPAERLGYRIDIVGGTPPNSLYSRGFQAGEVVAQPRGEFEWGFSYDDVEFAFDVEVRAVDLNGNVSAPALVHIESTDRGGGCMSATAAHSEWLLLPVVGLLLRRRRRR